MMPTTPHKPDFALAFVSAVRSVLAEIVLHGVQGFSNSRTGAQVTRAVKQTTAPAAKR